MSCLPSFKPLQLAACAVASLTLAPPAFALTLVYEIDQSPFSGLLVSRAAHEDDAAARPTGPVLNGSITFAGAEPIGTTTLTVLEFELVGAVGGRGLSISLAPDTPSTLDPAESAIGVFAGDIHALLAIEGSGEPVPVLLTARGDGSTVAADAIDLSLAFRRVHSDDDDDDDDRRGSREGRKGARDDDDDRKNKKKKSKRPFDDGPGSVDLAALLALHDDDAGTVVLRATGSVVPEPSTGLLLGIGLSGLALYTRRLQP